MSVGEMCVMDHTGDTKSVWDRTKPDEVDLARNTFNVLKKKGYIAYQVQGDGGKGQIMTEFDPNAEKVILSPPMAGG